MLGRIEMGAAGSGGAVPPLSDPNKRNLVAEVSLFAANCYLLLYC
jgi:hypothetical protein